MSHTWQERAEYMREERDALKAENDRFREALEEIRKNNHGFHRPAGTIARHALEGKPLPGWER